MRICNDVIFQKTYTGITLTLHYEFRSLNLGWELAEIHYH